ncbi:TPA: DUF551 domain-containing protein [Salmonella enterica]|nr:DUF551 domain-containing protein [Salmonella enterica]HCL5080617.1 DUF551 domain-containing protein [Salmonella enterica]HCL5333533.1 DUF551 domain-containing protein [Salmonella enterica]
MTIITRERLLTIQQWRETYGPGSNVVLPAEEAEELARIVLASLEAEPVSQTYKLNELSGNSPVTPDGWISCSERMPEIRQTVMGWNGYAVRQCVYTRNGYAKTQKGREPRFETSTGIWHGVTHWMPLPEPPQEVNRG